MNISKNISLFAIYLISTPSLASGAGDDAYCVHLRDVAEATMILRQLTDTPPQEVVTQMAEHIPADIARKMVVDAYAIPQFLTANGTMSAVDNYADHWWVTCMKAIGSQ